MFNPVTGPSGIHHLQVQHAYFRTCKKACQASQAQARLLQVIVKHISREKQSLRLQAVQEYCTFMYRTPSIMRLTLSLVIAL